MAVITQHSAPEQAPVALQRPGSPGYRRGDIQGGPPLHAAFQSTNAGFRRLLHPTSPCRDIALPAVRVYSVFGTYTLCQLPSRAESVQKAKDT